MAIISRWIVNELSADPALVSAVAKRPDNAALPGIYRGRRLVGAAFPHVVFTNLDPGRSVQVTGSIEVGTVSVVSVVAVGTAGAGPLDPIAARIKAVLHHRHNIAVSGGGEIVACTLRGGLEYEDFSDGIYYSRLGWRFDILTKEA